MEKRCFCGSYAINEHMYGRIIGDRLDLCDTHYWIHKYEELEQQLDDMQKRIKEYEHMIDWMEYNSNSSLCDYYNREEG